MQDFYPSENVGTDATGTHGHTGCGWGACSKPARWIHTHPIVGDVPLCDAHHKHWEAYPSRSSS